MLAPLLVVAVGVVVSGVRTAGLLSMLGSKHSHFCLYHQVLELHGFDEVRVPNVAAVSDANILNLLGELVQFVAAFFEVVLATEHRSVALHRLLHTAPNHCNRGLAGAVPEGVEFCNRLFASIRRQVSLSLTGGKLSFRCLGSCTAKDNQVEQ